MAPLFKKSWIYFLKHRQNFNRILHIAGKLAAFIFLIFFLSNLFKNSEQLDRFTTNPSNWLITLVAGFLYSINLSILGLAWSKLLHVSGPKKINIVAIFLSSQINKYIPGNIFHFVSRNLNAKALGLELKKIISSISIEIISMVLAASIIATYFLLNISSEYENFIYSLVVVSLACFIIAPIALSKLNIQLSLFTVMKAFPLYLIFFIVTGVIIYLAGFHTDLIRSETSAILLISFICFTWTIGFITPGVSGGIGIREGAIILLGAHAFQGADLVTLGLLFRLITVFGDLFAKFLGGFLNLYTRHSNSI